MSQSPRKIQTFFWYSTEAEAAARFYTAIFPDSSFDGVTEMIVDRPSGPPKSVFVVDFTLFGQPYMAMSAGPNDDFNDAISMMVECDTQAELDRYWDALLEGGEAGTCGWLVDRFGVRWQITPTILFDMQRDPDRARAKKVIDAMSKMVKLDIATLRAVYGSQE
ncbi:MAG: VOC family protein [bacterium]